MIHVLIFVFGFGSLVMFLCLSVSLQIFIMQKCATLGKGELNLLEKFPCETLIITSSKTNSMIHLQKFNFVSYDSDYKPNNYISVSNYSIMNEFFFN